MKGRSSYARSMDEGTEAQEGTTVSSPLAWARGWGVEKAGLSGCSCGQMGRLAGAAPGQTPGSRGGWSVLVGGAGRQTGRGLAAAAAREGARRAGELAGRLPLASRERRVAGAGEAGTSPWMRSVGSREEGAGVGGAPGSRPLPQRAPGGLYRARGSERRSGAGAGTLPPLGRIWAPTASAFSALQAKEVRGAWQVWAPRGFRRQRLFAGNFRNKANILVSNSYLS